MSVDQLRQLAQSHYLSGDVFGAEEIMRKIVGDSERPDPSDVLTLARLAIELVDFERAEMLLEYLLERAPFAPPIVSSAVELYASQGKHAQATELLTAALERHPADPPLLALALTHLDEPDDALTEQAERVAADLPDDSERKTTLLYPLARTLDRRGEYGRAWDVMMRANELSRQRRGDAASLRPDALYEQLRRRIRRAIEIGDTLPAGGTDGPAFVFMTGAPRTGSSLLQTVLAAHPGVASVGERAALLGELTAIADSSGPAPTAARLAELARADLAGLERHGHAGGIVVDKTPHNFYVAPLLAATHANVVMVNVLRDPRDVAVSMLFHDFSPAFPEATALECIERMLSARAEGALEYRESGLPMLSVSFEGFLDDPDAGGRRIAEFAGIDWDPGALAADRRTAVVSTFSVRQVRSEISRPAAERWKRYETQLAELEPAFRNVAALQRELDSSGAAP